MRNRLSAAILCCLILFFLPSGTLSVSAAESASAEAQRLMDGIIEYKLKEAGAGSVQQWIDGALTQNAGSASEWYVIALSQSGQYDFSAYEAALLQYLHRSEVYSATSRQKYALALIAAGSTDGYIRSTLDDSVGQQGVMSWIFGLHLLSNGYTSGSHTLSSVREKLLSLQLADGGWAVMGASGDTDVTAMAVQALAPYYTADAEVKKAVDNALTLLSERQLPTGDYAGYGTANPESTAQVIAALSSLGIDGEADGRFIKDGNTLFDGIQRYRLADGSFCHSQGGDFNETATVQVFYSLVSYLRMAKGQGPFYILDARNPSGLSSSGTPSAGQEGTVQDGAEVSADRDAGTASAAVPDIGQDAASSAGTEQIFSEITSAEMTETSETEGTSADADGTDGLTDDAAGGGQADRSHGKLWLCLGILLICAAVCAFLYLTKRRNGKNFVTVLLAGAAAAAIVCTVNIQSVDDFYGAGGAAKENAAGTVTISIRCDTLVGKTDSVYVPADGTVLETTELAIEAGDTVFDVLTEAVRGNKIQMESSGVGDAVYIEGIHYIYEFDFGELSGWMYRVNGVTPSVGCGEYRLSDGDAVEWLYTCELGSDIG